VLKLLREPRYAALTVLMVIVAIVCVGAGTWQVARFDQKVHENDALRGNAHATVATIGAVLPLVGTGPAPTRAAVEFRPVRVTGTYDVAHQSLIRSRTLGDQAGFYVLTPLRTARGELLVVRGFITQPRSGAIPTPPAPPASPVTIRAHTQPPETRRDEAARLDHGQVESINPGEQAHRLAAPVYNGYVQLDAHQAGAGGLHAVPPPDLGNPAGGAVEPQHFAYVIQWYLFAALALAAPFVMARAETRQGRRREIDFDAESAPEPSPPSTDQVRSAKLADRYGHAR
jgi:cytochrome oxidase assembly protein ShyY1